MATTKESAPDHHQTLILGLIFIFIRISSQQETAINSTVSTMPSPTITINPSATVQNNSTNSETSSASTTKFINTVAVTEIPSKSVIVTTTVSSDTRNNSCAEFKKLAIELQPKHTDFAKIKKCCPEGEMYLPSGRGRDKCDIANVAFVPVIIEAIFFEHCIEDTEKVISLQNEIGNPCGEHEALIYSKEYGDNLYVLQNGSLLRVDDDFTGFDIFDDYCLDMDRDSSFLTAIVCNQSNPSQHLVHVSKAQSYLYAICEYDPNSYYYGKYTEFVFLFRHVNFRSVSAGNRIFLFVHS